LSPAAEIKIGGYVLVLIEITVTWVIGVLDFTPIVEVLNFLAIVIFMGVFVFFIRSLVDGIAEGLILVLVAVAVTNISSIIVLFATLYQGLGLEGDHISKPVSLANCIYFSIITLTTVGYGDIYPSSEARGVAAFEALSGYFIMGFLVSVAVIVFQKMTGRNPSGPRAP